MFGRDFLGQVVVTPKELIDILVRRPGQSLELKLGPKPGQNTKKMKIRPRGSVWIRVVPPDTGDDDEDGGHSKHIGAMLRKVRGFERPSAAGRRDAAALRATRTSARLLRIHPRWRAHGRAACVRGGRFSAARCPPLTATLRRRTRRRRRRAAAARRAHRRERACGRQARREAARAHRGGARLGDARHGDLRLL